MVPKSEPRGRERVHAKGQQPPLNFRLPSCSAQQPLILSSPPQLSQPKGLFSALRTYTRHDPKADSAAVNAPDTTITRATHACAFPHSTIWLEQRGPERRRRTGVHPRNCTSLPGMQVPRWVMGPFSQPATWHTRLYLQQVSLESESTVVHMFGGTRALRPSLLLRRFSGAKGQQKAPAGRKLGVGWMALRASRPLSASMCATLCSEFGFQQHPTARPMAFDHALAGVSRCSSRSE